MKIKEWAEEDRPREKMLLKGIASLSDAELLAILIGSGNSRETAVQLSQRILNSVNNNLNALGKLSVKECSPRTWETTWQQRSGSTSRYPLQQRCLPDFLSPALRSSPRRIMDRTHEPFFPGDRKGQD